MWEKEYRAYDNKQRTMVYNKDLWLPQGLKKLGHKEYPVDISDSGIHYTLDCISNHYENDWEEDVVALFDIEIMQATHRHDASVPSRKIFCSDIISFYQTDNTNELNPRIGVVKYCDSLGDWVVMNPIDQVLEFLKNVEQPKVLGNLFDHPDLLH